MSGFRVVEQVGDCTFAVAGHVYDALDVALVAAVGLTVGADEEREYFVDGPGLDRPIGAGRQTPETD